MNVSTTTYQWDKCVNSWVIKHVKATTGGGSEKLFFTSLIDPLSLKESHHKPMGMKLSCLLCCHLGSRWSWPSPKWHLKGTSTIKSYRFVMELQQWYEVYKLGEDQLHGLPVVALRIWLSPAQCVEIWSANSKWLSKAWVRDILPACKWPDCLPITNCYDVLC